MTITELLGIFQIEWFREIKIQFRGKNAKIYFEGFMIFLNGQNNEKKNEQVKKS